MRSPLSRLISNGVLRIFIVAEALGALGLVAMEAGAGQGPSWHRDILLMSDALVLAAFAGRLLFAFYLTRKWPRAPETIFIASLVVVFLFVTIRIAALVVLLHDGFLVVRRARSLHAGQRVLRRVGDKPARSLVVSFLSLIAVGSVLLAFPAAAADGVPVAFIDAFFTAVSATCVTGLITLDTASAWSPFGQGVIFALFQLGGLGIMVISAAMTLAVGRRIAPSRHSTLGSMLDEDDVEELRRLIRAIVVWTLLIEIVGALLLLPRFLPHMPWRRALSHAIFHAVSAFCNAGFSLYSDSLTAFADDYWVNGVIIVLLSMGGIGFGVLVALWRRYVSRRSRRLSLHAKLALVTSGALLWFGSLFYFFFEFDRSLAGLDLSGKIIAAIFQSATTRTAGFNTVSYEALHPATLLLMVAWMFIGASPGSTGGGMKTTTFALVLASARAVLRERSEVELFGRRISQAQVTRALALAGGAVFSFVIGFGALLISEDLDFRLLLFEAASALGTVGLSLGITPELSGVGRFIVCVLMFFGRVGPLTAVAALATRASDKAAVTLPEGKVLVG